MYYTPSNYFTEATPPMQCNAMPVIIDVVIVLAAVYGGIVVGVGHCAHLESSTQNVESNSFYFFNLSMSLS